ncbi:flagellar hook-length control protein FliK [Sporolactobacillus pectinivorans]|uniref:flagellar hook-length control protein FliK n=1 Tax=Sporolactobacillus pectinivorans TaxID=1591408 RepID=UPI000C263CA3|nr:flagellar hook-length control protein FliK [Sporolactobacillus pectinivorans]
MKTGPIVLNVQASKTTELSKKKKSAFSPDFSFLALFNTAAQSASPPQTGNAGQKGEVRSRSGNSKHQQTRTAVSDAQLSRQAPAAGGQKSKLSEPTSMKRNHDHAAQAASAQANPHRISTDGVGRKIGETSSEIGKKPIQKNAISSAGNGKETPIVSQVVGHSKSSTQNVPLKQVTTPDQIKSDLATLISTRSGQTGSAHEVPAQNSAIASKIVETTGNFAKTESGAVQKEALPNNPNVSKAIVSPVVNLMAQNKVDRNVSQTAGARTNQALKARVDLKSEPDQPVGEKSSGDPELSASNKSINKSTQESFTVKKGTLPVSQMAARQMSHAELLASFSTVSKSEDGKPVGSQVTDQLLKWMGKPSFQIETGGTKNLTITLHPESLGKLTVSVTQTADGMTARLIAGTKTAKDLLQSGLSQLKDDLAAQGITIHQIDVSRQWQSSAPGGSQQMNQDQQQAFQNHGGHQDEQNEENQRKKSPDSVAGLQNDKAFSEWMTGGVQIG